MTGSSSHFDHASTGQPANILHASRRRKRLKLAIVEDEVILAMALTLMLEDWGHQVVGTADSEAAARALVESERPDAVLMDIRLGRKDSGLRAARILRETTDIPIVFCTAYADSLSIQ